MVVPQVQKWAVSSPSGFVFMSMAGTMFNFLYILLINLVLQAIIAGLIIDAFSELRDESESILRDTVSGCFVCSIKRCICVHSLYLPKTLTFLAEMSLKSMT